MNYRGPSKSDDDLDLRGVRQHHGDLDARSATTPSPPSWVWTKNTFTLPAPLARFFSSGTLQIRYGTTSNADASDIDQLLITGTR